MYKYLQNRRIIIAAEKLVKTEKTITQIVYEAGYDTQQIYLYPPKIYRDIGIFIPKQNRICMCYSYISCSPFLAGWDRNDKFITEMKEIAA